MNYVDRNRINNFIYRYSLKDTAENFNKLAEVITKRKNQEFKENSVCL